MAKYLEGFAGSNEERIGLVMPVYAWGPPRMVADFVGKLKPRADQYVFAVADCGEAPTRRHPRHRLSDMLLR